MKQLLFPILVLLLFTSCGGTKTLTYFQDKYDGYVTPIATTGDLRVQSQDKVTIVVNSSDAELADLYNLPIQARRVGSANTLNGLYVLSAYTVDSNGDINFPVLGKIHVLGMNRQEIAETIQTQLVEKDLCKDAIVTVEFDNMYINVMGEVASPGRFQLTQDKVSILDALSMAGDLTIQGRRENVAVVRHEGGDTHTYILNLDSLATITQSPAYYMKQGDVVVVEPNDYRKRQTTVNGNNILSTGFWISVASLITSVLVLVVK